MQKESEREIKQKDITTRGFPQHPTGPSSPSLLFGSEGPGVILLEEPLLYSPSPGYPWCEKAIPTDWAGMCVSSCFLSHSLPPREFLS